MPARKSIKVPRLLSPFNHDYMVPLARLALTPLRIACCRLLQLESHLREFG